MKKMFKLFMCAAIIAAGFTACSEEVTPIPEGVEETQAGLLTVNFKESEPMTRASGDKDVNATASERAVKSVTILVFNEQGVCKVDTTLLSSEFTPDQNTDLNKYKAAKINVPLGRHYVYAGINLTSGAANKMKETLGGKGTSNGYDKYVYFGTDASTPTALAISELYKANEFPMFASDAQFINIVPQEAQNVVTVPIDRMVAKVTVQKGSQFSGDNLKASGAVFNGTNVEWSLGNLNGKLYPYGKANFGHDPNYDFLPGDADAFKGQAGNTYRKENFVDDFSVANNAWTGFVTVDEATTPVESRHPKYAPENNSAQKRMGESTFAAIKVKFAPDKVYTYKANDPAPIEAVGYMPNLSGNQTIHVVTAGSVYYFLQETDANAYATYCNSKVIKYDGQYCFYHLMLGREKDKGLTKRNHYYALTMNKITGLGTPTGELADEDVDNTSDDQGLLEVTLAVNEWVLEEEGVNLEK
jgi:hypothetical protein